MSADTPPAHARRAGIRLLAAFCLAAAPSSRALAQEPPTLQSGADVSTAIVTTTTATRPAAVRPVMLPDAVLPVWSPVPAAAGVALPAQDESARRRPSIVGGVVGFIVGATAGGLIGCAMNRDDYGVFCGGQNDTKVVVSAAIGGVAGATAGALIFARRR